MAQAAPPAPGPEPPVYDLFDLSIGRWWVWKWRSLMLANTKVRREAKAVLFGELAEALRHNMPLPEALAANSQTLEESWRRRRHGVGRGADSRHSALQRLIALFMVVFGFGAFWFYMTLSFRYSDPERVARLMANRLRELVIRGVPLSEAMRRCGRDYDRAELAIVENAEKWGNLPEALQRLAAYQVTEKTLTAAGASAMYPVILAYALLFPVWFIQIVILPKFREIFDQFGAQLPALTTAILDATHLKGWPGLAMVLWGLIIVFWIVRALMNGNFMARYVLACGILTGGFAAANLGGLFVAAVLAYRWHERTEGEIGPQIALFVLVAVLLLLLPYLLAYMEVWVLRIEHAARRILPLLPLAGRFVGRASKTEADSRWLAALSTALAAGVPAPQALRAAGAMAGGGYRRSSDAAAALASRGFSIGAACVQARVLEPPLNHRLVLADRSPQYLAALQAIAEDASENAQEVLFHTGRTADIAGQVALGIVMAIVVVSLYLPLFEVPRILNKPESNVLRLPAPATTLTFHRSADLPLGGRRA